MTGKPSGMLSKLADFGHGDTTSAHYDAWAAQYDADLLGEFGYSGHVIAAEAMNYMSALDRPGRLIVTERR